MDNQQGSTQWNPGTWYTGLNVLFAAASAIAVNLATGSGQLHWWVAVVVLSAAMVVVGILLLRTTHVVEQHWLQQFRRIRRRLQPGSSQDPEPAPPPLSRSQVLRSWLAAAVLVAGVGMIGFVVIMAAVEAPGGPSDPGGTKPVLEPGPSQPVDRLAKQEMVTADNLEIQILSVKEADTNTAVTIRVTNRAPTGGGSNRPEIHHVELVLPGSRTRWASEVSRPLERYGESTAILNKEESFIGRIPADFTTVDLLIEVAPDGGAEPTSIRIPLTISP
jgi:hypothetical protein